MRLDEVLREHELGRVRVRVGWIADENPDYSYLGKWSEFVRDPATLCYDTWTGNAWDGSRWRDSRGRFAEEPESYGDRRDYRYITEGACQYTRKDSGWFRVCFENCQRLARLGQDWQYLGVAAEVSIAGRVVGYASVWGIEQDWRGKYAKDSEAYILEVGREMLAEAFEEARGFADVLKEVCA